MTDERTQSYPGVSSAAIPVVDFKRQYAALREEILATITEVCDSQQFILGPTVQEFERAAAERCGARFAVGCSSGTDALWLALVAAGIQPGEDVITTPFSFFATVSSILRAGAKPLLVDIDPKTFNMDMAHVDEILRNASGQIAAVMPIHLYGQCADMTALESLRTKSGTAFKIIEDAAQAFGARWEGRRAGSLGDAAAFSFYPTKNLSCFGDGGMVTTSDAALAEMATVMRAHGMRQRYYHDEAGWNCRLDSIQAAVLSVKLRYIDGWNARRREVAGTYDRLFEQAGLAVANDSDRVRGVVLPWVDPRAEHVFHQYVVKVCDGRRDELRGFLSERGIGSEIYYPVPLHLQKALRSLGYKGGDFPVTENAARTVLALPIFPEITGEEQERVVGGVADFYRE